MYRPRFWILVTAILLLAVAALAMGTAGVPEDPPVSGDWIINGQKEFEGKSGYVEGNLIVILFAKLEIIDATLVINNSLLVDEGATLIVRNSTIKFNCSLSKPNSFEMFDDATCSIIDGDDNPLTPGDASHITSTNDVPYNISTSTNTSLLVRNSVISKCGRPFFDSYITEGFLIKSVDTLITGSVIKDGYYGLILEGSERLRIVDTTIEDCHVGIYMVGTRESILQNSTIRNCTNYGMEYRGFHGNDVLDSLSMYGNGVSDFQGVYASGFNNQMVNCSFGPGDPKGMHLEDVNDISFNRNRVNGCAIGVEIMGGDVELIQQEVNGCAQGIIVSLRTTVRFEDLKLTDTTLDIGLETTTNISVNLEMHWDRVVANLTCDISVPLGTVVDIESSVLNFGESAGGTTGLYVLEGGSLEIANSTIDSPTDHSLIVHFEDNSRIGLFNCTFLHMGTSTGGIRDTGMFIAGTGQMEECTLSDSIVGLVVGRTQMNIVNLTVRDCLTGILTDGNLGRGGLSIRGLDISGCDVAVRAVNDGSLTLDDGRFHLEGEGFNMSSSSVLLRDSTVSDPGTGSNTAVLRDTSTLDIVNSQTSRAFDIGPSENAVNIYWYLNLTLRYLSDGSPLSEALVTVREVSGGVSIRDEMAGVDGTLSELLIREITYVPDIIVSTPHTITVNKAQLSDSFSLTVESSMDHIFYMDNFPPVIVVNEPEDGSFHNVPTITFAGEAYDAVVTATEGLDHIQYRVDGGEWVRFDLPVDTLWSVDVTLDSGFHTVEFQVRDLIGNVNTTQVSVEIDTEPPSLVVLTPEDGILINETEVLVSGVSDPNATVTVNGDDVELDAEGRFNITVPLEEGTNVIEIVAVDDQTNTVRRTRNVTVDTVPPLVSIDQEELRTNQLVFTLSGSKKANSTLYINGFLPRFFAATTFETQVDLPVEGLNDVDMWSEDMAGNNWSTTLLIERDTTPPDLVVGQLPEFTNKPSVTVQGSVDDADATVTVNDVEVTLSGLTFAQVVALAEGENTITVRASDDLGNEAEPVVQAVTLSTTPPSLVILTDKTVETLEQMHELEGETEPGLPVNVKVELGPYSKTYNLLAGDDGAFSVNVELPQIGSHSITVTVTNEAGNQATEQLTFIRERQEQKPPPPPPEDSWLSENWEYAILLAAIIGAATVWLITLSKARQRREEMEARRVAHAEDLEEAEGWDEEEEDEDEATEEEDEDEATEEETTEEEAPDDEESPAYVMDDKEGWEDSEEPADEEEEDKE